MLEQVGHKMGFMSGTRTRGRKPTRMAEAYPELQAIRRENVCSGNTKLDWQKRLDLTFQLNARLSSCLVHD